jgi:thioredoxin reductase (NADPH)
MKNFDVIILGGGPAGLTAAIYITRGKKSALVIDTGTVGGQVNLTHAIANYPGLEEISGYKLARNMKKQAKSFGAVIKSNSVIEDFSFKGSEKIVTVDGEVYTSKAVIIASGGTPRPLGLESEQLFKGKGISYCATCDGDFFQDQDIMVIGGGNSALEEAVSLTQYASKVTIVHQFDHFQGYPHAIEEAQNNEKIDIILESEVEEFLGDEGLTGARIVNTSTGEKQELKVTGAFIFIGYMPNTEMFKDIIDINERSEIQANELMETSLEGVFAAGDVREKKFRQVTTAVSDGTIAALSAMEYLNR